MRSVSLKSTAFWDEDLGEQSKRDREKNMKIEIIVDYTPIRPRAGGGRRSWFIF